MDAYMCIKSDRQAVRQKKSMHIILMYILYDVFIFHIVHILYYIFTLFWRCDILRVVTRERSIRYEIQLKLISVLFQVMEMEIRVLIDSRHPRWSTFNAISLGWDAGLTDAADCGFTYWFRPVFSRCSAHDRPPYDVTHLDRTSA